MNQLQYENKFLVSVTGVSLVFFEFNDFWDKVSLSIPEWTWLHYGTLTGLEFTNIPPLLASKVLGLYTCHPLYIVSYF